MTFDNLPDLNIDAPSFYPDADDRIEGIQAPEAIDGYQRTPRLTKAAARRRHLRLLRNDAAIDALKQLPGPGEETLLVMTGQYHGVDLIEAIIRLADCPAEQVYLSTLGTNKANIRAILEHLDAGRIQRLHFVVADVFARKDAAEFAFLTDELHQRAQRLTVARNHAKLSLFKFTDGRHITLHGSLNLRRCNSFEQVAISHHRETFEFFERFIRDIATEGLTA